ncbi:MAG: lytic transglycosylase domain-containing protein [Desulfatirhabdiaceae bacterium]
MTLKTGMTVEDYIRKTSTTYRSVSVSRVKKQPDSASDTQFSGILSTFQKPAPTTEKKSFKGLSIVEYLARPVSARVERQPDATGKIQKKVGESAQLKTPESDKAASQPPQANPSKPEGISNRQNAGVLKTDTKPDIGIQKKDVAAIDNSFSSGNAHIDSAIDQISEKYGLPSDLIHSMVQVESNYKVNAVSPAGAQGLMQLMPDTAKEMGVTHPFNIRQNIEGGARYLKKMLETFNGNMKKALAAYNAGPATVKRYNGDVPYPETRSYVKRIMSMNQNKLL